MQGLHELRGSRSLGVDGLAGEKLDPVQEL
jgi:hypothetical protein